MLGDEGHQHGVFAELVQNKVYHINNLLFKACDAGRLHGRVGGLEQLAGLVADELVADIAFVLKIQIERPFGHTGFLYNVRNRSLLHPFCRKQMKGGVQKRIPFLFLLPLGIPPLIASSKYRRKMTNSQ